jgi:hypothetical protein
MSSVRIRAIHPFHWAIGIAGLALVAVVATGIAFAGRGSPTEGGAPTALDVPQQAEAADGGLVVTADAAAFSGTATLVRLTIMPGDALELDWDQAVNLSIPANAMQGTLLPLPGIERYSLPPGDGWVLRFQPLRLGAIPDLTISLIDVRMADGSNEVIAGDWHINLTAPADLASRLQVEYLAGSAVSDAGIGVAVDGGVRSTSETLVTVRLESERGVRPLGQPSILQDGKRLIGGLVAEDEGGTLLTYAFPATPFGSALAIDMGSFVDAESERTGSVTIDVGAVVARQGLEQQDGELGVILPVDITFRSGADLDPRLFTLRFGAFSNQPYATGKALELGFGGAYTERTAWSVVSASGDPLAVGAMSVGYKKDSLGVASDPTTQVRVWWEEFSEINGPITVTYAGTAEDIVRGDWTLNVSPTGE